MIPVFNRYVFINICGSPILKYFKVSYKTIEKEEEKIVPKLVKILCSNHREQHCKERSVFVLENNIAV